ncbi:MAG: hypothetical protein LBP53_06750 [Candidatus Peribacteria bacterium]|jgi:hypothetical protein|nr:hypothetical protein [Candidatus Peribacteria bacterium]
MGNGNSISGNYSLVAGSGVKLVGNQSFVRNGAGSAFSVNASNVFALNVAKGMIVKSASPHSLATLTLSGDLRIEENANDAKDCTNAVIGVTKTVIKTVGTDTVSCPCFCDGKNGTGWKSLLDSTFCRQTCGDIYISIENQTDCTAYTLSSCPANGNCSSCGGKYKLDTCKSGYTLQNNLCVINGACGSANGTNRTSAPSTAAEKCTAGTASSVSGSGPRTRTCAGTNGGNTASCTANKTATVVNGACGSANGTNRTSAPSTAAEKCTAGTASSVSGSGPRTWTCAGANGGSTASCTANKTENGACGSANGTNRTSAPSTAAEKCTAGTASSVSGSGPRTWTCAGANGGNTASCSANKACTA